jgi:hypothetical protein
MHYRRKTLNRCRSALASPSILDGFGESLASHRKGHAVAVAYYAPRIDLVVYIVLPSRAGAQAGIGPP